MAAFLVALLLATAAAGQIEARDYSFTPSDLIVGPGGTVTLHNGGLEPHTVTSTNGSFSAEAAPGKSVTFQAPQTTGRYPFKCAYHDWMKGNLTVDAAATQPPPTTGAKSSPGPGAPILWLAVSAIVWSQRRGSRPA